MMSGSHQKGGEAGLEVHRLGDGIIEEKSMRVLDSKIYVDG